MTTKLRNDDLDALLARTVMILRDAGNFDPSDADIYDAMATGCLDLIIKGVGRNLAAQFAAINRSETAYQFVRGVLKLKQQK